MEGAKFSFFFKVSKKKKKNGLLPPCSAFRIPGTGFQFREPLAQVW